LAVDLLYCTELAIPLPVVLSYLFTVALPKLLPLSFAFAISFRFIFEFSFSISVALFQIEIEILFALSEAQA
jgi:hypothetical protein